MSNYETIEGTTMVFNTDPEVDYSGVSVSDERPGQYQVYWKYNPNTGLGGITGDSWPGDMDVQNALDNLNADDPSTVDAVSAIVYNYTSDLLAYGTGEEWEKFRNYYRDRGCLVF